jgi:hypothetical protein
MPVATTDVLDPGVCSLAEPLANQVLTVDLLVPVEWPCRSLPCKRDVPPLPSPMQRHIRLWRDFSLLRPRSKVIP